MILLLYAGLGAKVQIIIRLTLYTEGVCFLFSELCLVVTYLVFKPQISGNCDNIGRETFLLSEPLRQARTFVPARRAVIVVSSVGSSPTPTNVLPKFLPAIIARNALGACANPVHKSSLYLI